MVPHDGLSDRGHGGLHLCLFVSALLGLIEIVEDLERDGRKGEPPIGGVVIPVVTIA